MYNNQYNPYFGYNQPQYGANNQNQYNIPNQQQINPPMPNYNQNQIISKGLQGKSVDSIDVVRATEIPLDGSTSYFPLADGTSIITKKLKNDGTTEILTYKPFVENKKEEEKPQYVVKNDLKAILSEFSEEIGKYISEELNDVKEELKSLKNREKK